MNLIAKLKELLTSKKLPKEEVLWEGILVFRSPKAAFDWASSAAAFPAIKPEGTVVYRLVTCELEDNGTCTAKVKKILVRN